MSEKKYRIFIKDAVTESEKNITGYITIEVLGPKKRASGEVSGLPVDKRLVGSGDKIGPWVTDYLIGSSDESLSNSLMIIFINGIIDDFGVDLTGRLIYDILQKEQPKEEVTKTEVVNEPPKELKNIKFNVQKPGYMVNGDFGELKVK